MTEVLISSILKEHSYHSSKDHTIATPVAGVYSPDAVGRVGLLNLSISMLNIWFSPTIYMFMKRAATTAYIIRVQMQQNETIIFFVSTRIAMLKVLLPSSKLLRNKGDISEKLWTAKREIETMLSACLNQKISWINEVKRENNTRKC